MDASLWETPTHIGWIGNVARVSGQLVKQCSWFDQKGCMAPPSALCLAPVAYPMTYRKKPPWVSLRGRFLSGFYIGMITKHMSA